MLSMQCHEQLQFHTPLGLLASGDARSWQGYNAAAGCIQTRRSFMVTSALAPNLKLIGQNRELLEMFDSGVISFC